MTMKMEGTIPPGQVIEYFIKQHYPDEVEQLRMDVQNGGHGHSLSVDYQNLIGILEETGNNGLVTNNPANVLEMSNQVLNDIIGSEHALIRLDDVPYNIYLRSLDAQHVGKFISTNAMVRSVSPIRPRIVKASFECRSCANIYKIPQTSNLISEPPHCQECGGRSFRLLENASEFINTQILKLEEPLELRKDGTTREFLATMEGDLVNPDKKVTPGEVVQIIGFLRLVRDEKTKQFNFYLQLNNIKQLDKTFQDIEITEDDIEQIEALSRQPDLMEQLKRSVAPRIYGHHEVKEGLVLQLFSGNSGHDTMDIHGPAPRSIIHILIVGDPGIAKSETLKGVSRLSPKGISVNGAVATKAGLMGAAVKDDTTGKWTIEAGAMPLADQGIICIDELDKMPKDVVLALNEPMEQQTVTGTKAGLNVMMSSRTSVLAAANPRYGRFRMDKTITDQITIPDSTFTRFDLIYALEDRTDYDGDHRLATHLLSDDTDLEEVLDPELIRTYIAYAKREYTPKLLGDAQDVLATFYAKTRKQATTNDDAKPITPRDLMALQRLTKTIARIHLRDYATIQDAQDAIRIYSESLTTIGLKPETAGQLVGEKSRKDLKNLVKAETIIRTYYDNYGAIMPQGAITDAVEEIQRTCGYEEDVATEIFHETIKNFSESIP